MSLQQRCLLVLRGSDKPLSVAEVARVINQPAYRCSAPISKLVLWGKAERADMNVRERRYRARDTGYEQWRDKEYAGGAV